MRVEVSAAEPGDLEVDLLALPVTDPVETGRVDERLRERLDPLVDAGELRGELGSALVVHLSGEIAAARVAAAGVGPAERVDGDAVRTAAAAVARLATRFGGSVGWVLDTSLGVPAAEQARAAVEGIGYGVYDPGRWKTENEKRHPVERVVIVGGDESAKEAAERAAQVVPWIDRARDLANAPGNELTPERLAERAADLAGGVEHLSVEALGPDEIDALGMGSFAGVARGSHAPPRLIVMRYTPPGATGEDTLGLVGKAITFDTGGISLKPAQSMEAMKGDMAGGGAVVAGMGAIADFGLPVKAIGVVAAAENMPGGHALKPGDIVRAANGKTIEITNTDAEGRLVLADALLYAREQGATHVVDLATLTGAMVFALGDLYAGVFANDDEWRDRLVKAGEASGDHLWPMPLHPRYRRYVDSTFADLKNSSALRQASPALAAEFLHEFAGEGPWAHVDMAGPGFIERSRGDYLTQPGGTGWGVRLLVELAASFA
jgi:leucyl aminopeptidase